jgi:hypothetical protein
VQERVFRKFVLFLLPSQATDQSVSMHTDEYITMLLHSDDF